MGALSTATCPSWYTDWVVPFQFLRKLDLAPVVCTLWMPPLDVPCLWLAVVCTLNLTFSFNFLGWHWFSPGVITIHVSLWRPCVLGKAWPVYRSLSTGMSRAADERKCCGPWVGDAKCLNFSWNQLKWFTWNQHGTFFFWKTGLSPADGGHLWPHQAVCLNRCGACLVCDSCSVCQQAWVGVRGVHGVQAVMGSPAQLTLIHNWLWAEVRWGIIGAHRVFRLTLNR